MPGDAIELVSRSSAQNLFISVKRIAKSVSKTARAVIRRITRSRPPRLSLALPMDGECPGQDSVCLHGHSTGVRQRMQVRDALCIAGIWLPRVRERIDLEFEGLP